MSQIYDAAASGHLDQAQQMITQVLADHPNSAKAHYVQAELYAKEGKISLARAELATAVQYDIGVAIVVFDNSAFGNVRRDQQRTFGRVIGSDLENPDFVGLGESFGVPSRKVGSPAALERELRTAFGGRGPTLLVVPVERDTEASPWDLIIRDGR